MKIAVRCIYHKAVTPSCDIIEMDTETWNRFRSGNRKQIVLEILHKEKMAEYIKEVVWIPLDGQDKLLVANDCQIIQA